MRPDMASLDPVFPAMPGGANGLREDASCPVGRAEYRSQPGEKVRILSEADLRRSA